MGKEKKKVKPQGWSGDSAAGFAAYVSADLFYFIRLTIE